MAESRPAMNVTTHIDGEKRKANRRLALVLGVVALGFYLLVVLFNR